MSTLTPNLKYIEQALDNLLSQFKGKPIYEAWVQSYVEQMQELENVFIQIWLLTNLENSEGAQLDGLGDIVGVSRLGRDDLNYKSAISAQIKANRLHSRISDIYTVMKLARDGSYELTELTNAKFIMRLKDTLDPVTDPSPEELNATLQKAKGGGVGAYFQYQLTPDDETFQFASGDTPEVDANQGWADDAQTTGGSWSDII